MERSGDLSVEETNEITITVNSDYSDLPAVHLAGNRLTLDGDIGIQFFLDIPEETAADATVIMEYRGEVKTKKVEAADKTSNGYRYVHRVAAKEMREPVVIRLEDSEGKAIQLLSARGDVDYTESGYSYTVEKYFNLARKNSASMPELIPLIEAMDTYGKYAQLYFGYNAEGIEAADVRDVTAEMLEQYRIERDEAMPEGLEYGGSNLYLETVVNYRHYFTVKSGHSISEYTFKVDGEVVTPTKSGSQYYIEVNGIAAKDLGTANETTITAGGSESRIKYSAMSYARTSIGNELNTADLCRAMYKYYSEAKTYFANH